MTHRGEVCSGHGTRPRRLGATVNVSLGDAGVSRHFLLNPTGCFPGLTSGAWGVAAGLPGWSSRDGAGRASQ